LNDVFDYRLGILLAKSDRPHVPPRVGRRIRRRAGSFGGGQGSSRALDGVGVRLSLISMEEGTLM